MNSIEMLSKAIAWIIITAIKIIVYPIYIIANTISNICGWILNAVSGNRGMEHQEL